MKKFIVLWFLLAASLAAAQTTPKLYFSDLTWGPKTGWDNGSTKGAAVTIWGQNLGASGTVNACGQVLSSSNSAQVAEWNATTNPTVPRGMGRITFWLNPAMSAACAEGISVTSGGFTTGTLPFTIAAGTIYYVSTTGNDANAGTTLAAPFRHVYKFNPANGLGDTQYIMYVRGGTYNTVDPFNGNAAALVELYGPWGSSVHQKALIAYPGELATMSLASCDHGFVYQNSDPGGTGGGLPDDYFTWSKLFFDGTGITREQDVVDMYGKFNRIVGNQIQNFRPSTQLQSGFTFVGASQNGSIYGNYYFNNGFDSFAHQIYIKTQTGYPVSNTLLQTHDIDVAWNEISTPFSNDNHGGAIFLSRESLVAAGFFTFNIFIHHNYFHDGTQGDFIYVADGSEINQVYIYSNIFSKGTSTAGFTGVPFFQTGTFNIFVYNNTIYQVTQGAASNSCMYSSSPNSSEHITTENNICFGNSGYTQYIFESGGGSWASTNDFFFNPGGSATWSGSVTRSGSIVNQNPLFTIAGTDFHLQSASPARSAGVNLTAALAGLSAGTVDYDGNLLPSAGAWDVGALQFAAAGPSTFTISGTVSPAAGSSAPSPLTVTLSGGASATQSTASYSFAALTPGLNYTVTPTAATYTFAPVSSTFNALAANQTANFTATGTANPTLQPLSDFGLQGIGTTSAAQATSLVNTTGTGPLTSIAISITGTNPGDFAIGSTACTATLNAASACSIQVTFTPTAAGVRSATLQVVDNIGTQLRPLSGTGYQAPIPSCLPAGASAKSARLVTCTNQVPAATMCWNMGSPPTTNGAGTCTAGTTYSGQFMVSATGTLFVTGTQAGNTDSSANYSFTINPTWTTGWILNSSVPGATTFGAIANAGIGPPLFLGSSQSTAVLTQPTQPTMAAVNATGYAYSAPGDPYYPVGGKGNCYTALTDSSSGMTGSAHASWSGGGSNVMSDINRHYFALTDGAGSVRYFHAVYDSNGCMQRDSTSLTTSPSGGTAAGFAFSRDTAATAYKIAGVGHNANGDPNTGTVLYQEALSGTTTVIVTRTKLFDFNNCPGVDGTLATQGGNGNLNVNYNGQRYSTSLNFPPAISGQDGAHWVLVWDRPTNSCATYFTGVVPTAGENPANGNIWTWCTGDCSQHGSNPAPLAMNTLCDAGGYGVHDTAAHSIGLYVGISGKCAPASANNSTTWTSGTNTLRNCNQDLLQCGGHGTSGYAMGWSALNNFLHRPANDLTTWTVIHPLFGGGTDQHGGDNWIGPAADVNPWLVSIHSNIVSNPCGAVPYCGELAAIKLDGTVVRFGPSFHQWTGGGTDLGPIMSMTQDGYCIVFESTWNHTRGLEVDGVTFRKDLFSICNLQ